MPGCSYNNDDIEGVFGEYVEKKSPVPKFGECYTCQTCGKTFSKSISLSMHITTHKKYPCQICSKSFSTFTDLQQHSTIHTGENQFQCKTCHRTFPRENSLKSHLVGSSRCKTNAGGKRFNCPVCSKLFSKIKDYEQHLYTHKDGKFYHCNRCKETFTDPLELKNHQLKHKKKLNERKNSPTPLVETEKKKGFQCNICLQNFAKAGHVKKHMQFEHSGET